MTLGPGTSSVEVGSLDSIFRSFWVVGSFNAGCGVPVRYVPSSRSCVREERGHRGSEAPLLSRNRRQLNAVKIGKEKNYAVNSKDQFTVKEGIELQTCKKRNP